MQTLHLLCAVQVFQPYVGDLTAFVATHGPAAGLVVLAIPAPAAPPNCSTATGCMAGNGQQQLLLKLEPHAKKEQLVEAASKVGYDVTHRQARLLCVAASV